MRTLAGRLLVVTAFVATWNAVQFGGLQLVDVLLAGAVLAYAADVLGGGKTPAAPRWLVVGALVLALVLVTHDMWPTDLNYEGARFRLRGYGAVATGVVDVDSNLAAGLKWLLALFLLPLLLGDAVAWRRRLLPEAMVAFAAGIAVSSLVAASDLVGVTSISNALIGYGDVSRQAGLTTAANSIGVSAAMAAPIAVWVMSRHRLAGVCLLVSLAAGEFAAGSRGGQALFVAAVLVTLVAASGTRRVLPWIVAVAAAGAGLVVNYLPPTVRLEDLLRFDGAETAARSDLGRRLLADQALEDFWHRPFDGIGLHVATEAHSIYLQVLAAGGIALALGLLWYFGGALRDGCRARDATGGLSTYLVVSVGAWLCVGIIENQLTDRFLYVPIGLLAGCALLARADRAAGAETAGQRETMKSHW